jgi:beta-barrel assembly-enhancing protease
MSQCAVRFTGHAGGYHKHMRLTVFFLLAALAFGPRAFAQSLPDLGGPGEVALSPQTERKLGESIVQDIRAHETAFVEDDEVEEYLGTIGARLTAVMAGARYDFQFFLLRDPVVNAFALPGGFVFVHTGLIAIADSESELASVIGHELGHVTQRHIARMFAQQQQVQMPMMVALAAALLLARSRPDLASGAAAATQATIVQQQLGYSRDYEREADRVGQEALAAAGFDPRAMASFFEKMQRSTRLSDDNSIPGYFRTHPLTPERIANAESRAAAMPYRQYADSPQFQLVRAKLKAEGGDPADAVKQFEGAVRDGRYASEAAAHYGLAAALLRARRPADADAQIAVLRTLGKPDPMIETLAARIKEALGERAAATALLEQARAKYPYSWSVFYAYIQQLQRAGRNEDAEAKLTDSLRQRPRDLRLHTLLAKTYASLGKRLLQHQEQAEVYVLQGSLPAAIEQLQLARTAGDGDFYQLSVVDARLKDLRAQHAADLRDQRR